MDVFVAKYLSLVLGAALCIWGILIVASNKFYEWWRDRYWQEPDEKHLTSQRLIYNRYVEGTGMIFLGAVIINIALSWT